MFLTHEQSLPNAPQRIVSLVPSQTELLHYFSLHDEVVGLTKFCIHPTEWFQIKTRIGGTKTLDIQKIRALQPDLIIANKEENIKEQVEMLAAEFPVWVTDVNTVKESLQMIVELGQLTNRLSLALNLVEKIRFEFEAFKNKGLPQIKVAYLIWNEPMMTVGGDTFINDMLLWAGFENVFANLKRYPEITVDAIRNAGAEWILLSSEPYPFKEKHMAALQQKLPYQKIILLDGEMFSWYGSRMLHAPAYFKSLRWNYLGK